MQKNILFIILSLQFGGAEKMLVNLARGLNKNYYTPRILCLDTKGELAAEIEQHGIPVDCACRKDGQDFGLFSWVKKIIQKNNIDLTHTHNIEALYYGGIGAKLAKRPVVHTQHDPQLTFSLKRIVKVYLSLLCVQHIAAVSEDIARVFRDYFWIKENKMSIIYNGIDINDEISPSVDNAIRQECNISPNDFVIGTVARFVEIKNLSSLLSAFSLIYLHNKNVHLVLAGDGPLKNALHAQAMQTEGFDNIHFLGYRNDVATVLSLFDIFVNCSLSEGLSMTILEAMSSRLPIIATDVGGNKELVKDYINGRLISARNPEALAAAALELMGNGELREKIGQTNRRIAVDRFSMETMVREYERLYQTLLF